MTDQVPKSVLELPWPARIGAVRRTIARRSWSSHGAISRVEYSVDGGPWQPARLVEPNIPGAWVRWRFVWDASPGTHGLRIRATDERGNTQPEEAPWNELGYLYGGVVEHPVDVLLGAYRRVECGRRRAVVRALAVNPFSYPILVEIAS